MTEPRDAALLRLFADVPNTEPDWPALEAKYGKRFVGDLRRWRTKVNTDLHRAARQQPPATSC